MFCRIRQGPGFGKEVIHVERFRLAAFQSFANSAAQSLELGLANLLALLDQPEAVAQNLARGCIAAAGDEFLNKPLIVAAIRIA